ncbi:hypothetical protein E6Q11_03150 [Candidatus Dojkabacteria bacterium]|uniref:Uncharacterized protein n=1 Tax=Candidatus Dojkabacteria bacterium TaxID=2099670 RepID=A0A5C7J6V0_9BACT|nr:MAG: hypothetical protein E6Q11_03150 [Candidatus Dojkabacteria bacterium]
MPPSINQASVVANRSGIASAATALSANENRRKLIIQNLGTNPLFVKFGAGASTTSFDLILKVAGGADDGTGGFYESDNVVYTGIVTIAGTTPRYTATEI